MVNGGYAFYNGTSMAAPHVAGVAGLLIACNSTLTPALVLKRIQAAALPRNATHGCPANTCGAGLLNAAVASRPSCSTGKP
jgi:serine protease